MLGDDHAQVIDAGRRWRHGWVSLRHLVMYVATNDERNGLADGSTFPGHVQARQVLRIEAELDATIDE